jgi:mRNA interferase RelE/StbE
VSTSSPGRGWIFSPPARRDFRRLDPPVQRRIVDALDRLVGVPPIGDVVRVVGSENEWRLRVGDWRVRFTHDDAGHVFVLHILPRGRAYRD